MPEYTHTHRVAETDDPTTLDLQSLTANTDVVLPDGDISFRGQFAKGWGAMRFRAADGASPTLVAPRGHNDFAVRFSGEHFVWRGIDIDVSEGVTGFQILSPEFRIDDITFHGRGTHPDESVTSCFAVGVTDPDGVGVIQNATARKGSAWGRYKGGNGRHFAWAGSKHVGTLYLDNCQVEEFGNNGIYGSAAEGPIVVKNCEFWNNNVASLRFGSEGCAVRNTTVGIDPERYTGPREPGFEGHAFFMRCIWNEAKVGALNAPGRVSVENSRIVVRGDESGRLPTGAAGLVVRPNGTAIDLIGTDIEITARHVPPIFAARPDATASHARPDGPTDIDVRQTRIVSHTPVSELVGVQGRDLRVRDHCHLEGKADGTRGVVVEQGGQIRAFEDSTVNVRGDTVIPTDTDTSTIDTEATASGPWPPAEGDADSPETGVDPAPEPEPEPEPVPDSELFTEILPMQELIVKTDADDPVEYELETAAHCSIEALDSPAGDSVSDDGTVASGKVWPGGADGYALTGALRDVSFSGGGKSGAYVEIDGQRVPWYNVLTHTVGNAGERLLTKAAETFGSLRSEE